MPQKVEKKVTLNYEKNEFEKNGQLVEYERRFIAFDGWEFDLRRLSPNDKKILDDALGINIEKVVKNQ